MMFLQRRLVVPHVEVTCGATHEELDDAASTRRMVKYASQHPRRTWLRVRRQRLAVEHGGQGDRSQSLRTVLEKVPTGLRW